MPTGCPAFWRALERFRAYEGARFGPFANHNRPIFGSTMRLCENHPFGGLDESGLTLARRGGACQGEARCERWCARVPKPEFHSPAVREAQGCVPPRESRAHFCGLFPPHFTPDCGAHFRPIRVADPQACNRCAQISPIRGIQACRLGAYVGGEPGLQVVRLWAETRPAPSLCSHYVARLCGPMLCAHMCAYKPQ